MRRIIVIAIAIAALIAVIRYADFSTMASALEGMSLGALLAIVTLLTLGAITRALRWAFYLRGAGLRISWWDGMTSYLAAMCASALPGGSVLQARLAQEHKGVRMRDAAPALFVGYVADAIALSTLALVFSLITHQPHGRLLIPIGGLALSAALVVIGRSQRTWMWAARLLGHFGPTRRWLPKEEDVHGRVCALMRPWVMAGGVALSAVTTFLSMALLVAFVNALTVRGIRPLEAATIHSTAQTIGVIAPIGFWFFSVSDSSLAEMLNVIGIGWVRVVFILVAIRSVSIVFQMVFGTLALLTSYRPLLASALNLHGRARSARRGIGHAWRLTPGKGLLGRLTRRKRREDTKTRPTRNTTPNRPLPATRQPAAALKDKLAGPLPTPAAGSTPPAPPLGGSGVGHG